MAYSCGVGCCPLLACLLAIAHLGIMAYTQPLLARRTRRLLCFFSLVYAFRRRDNPPKAINGSALISIKQLLQLSRTWRKALTIVFSDRVVCARARTRERVANEAAAGDDRTESMQRGQCLIHLIMIVRQWANWRFTRGCAQTGRLIFLCGCFSAFYFAHRHFTGKRFVLVFWKRLYNALLQPIRSILLHVNAC